MKLITLTPPFDEQRCPSPDRKGACHNFTTISRGRLQVGLETVTVIAVWTLSLMGCLCRLFARVSLARYRLLGLQAINRTRPYEISPDKRFGQLNFAKSF